MNEIDLYRKQSEMQEDSQSRLIEQQNQSQERMFAPVAREQLAEAQAAVIAQTNPARALRVILEGFRGRIESGRRDKFEQISDPLMNEQGISRVASMLVPFINDPMRFGDISGKEVRDIALKITNDVSEDIGFNWREYGIKDPTTKDIVVNSILALVFVTLTRSEGGGEKNFLSRVVLESVNQGGARPKKKESWTDKFKF